MTDEAFTQGILSMQETLYRVSFGLLREEQDRFDAVQEALTRAWAKRHSLRNEHYLKTWTVRILINECYTLLRKKRPVTPLVLADEVQKPEADDEHSALADAVLALPKKLRVPVILHYMEGYSIQEIASLLQIPKGTVGTHLHRARLCLKTSLCEEEHPDA